MDNLGDTDAKIVIAIIALFGVLLSVVINLMLSRRLMRKDIVQNYATKITEKRAECYPKLYSIVSDMGKKLTRMQHSTPFELVNTEDISHFIQIFDELNSQYGVFLSDRSGNSSAKIRSLCYKHLAKSAESQEADKLNFIKEFGNKLKDYQVDLKYDLGVFIVEFNDPLKSIPISTYMDLKNLKEK